MAEAKRDENFVPTLIGVSSADGSTPVTVYVDPVTHRLKVDLAAGSGTVTTVSVVSANGFAGTVATATSTPAITISTSITGIIKGNGTAISAAGASDVDSILPTQTGNNGKYLTTNGTISSWGTIAGGGTVTATGGALTLNSIVLGAGTTDTKVSTGITTNGTAQLVLGVNATTIGSLKMFGNTSGDVTLQPTAAAGTATVQTIPATTGTLVNRVTTANGVSASNTDGALSFTLGAITPSTVNGNTITTGTGILTLAAGKTLTVSNSITLAGTDATVMTFPTTTATIARTDSAQTFTGVQTMTSPSITTSIVTASTTFTLFNTVATTLSIGGAATTLTIGGTPTTAITHNYSTNATATATTKTVNVGTGGAAGSTTNINIGSSVAGTTTISSPTVSLGGTTGATTTGTIELGHATANTLSASGGVLSIEGVVIPSISSTNTLTNKRITPRTGSTTSSATPTINTDDVDIYSLTAQTVDITSFTTNLTGTPTHGQNLIIEITGTAARAITWGASFEASTVALPTTTVTTAMLTVGFKWNSTTSKWRCLAAA